VRLGPPLRLLQLTCFLSNLAASIPEAEKLRKRNGQWPPPNNGEDSYKRGLAGVMDDEMGWVD
jgi:beta-1,4-N-acetylglucosaminyltransferase